MLMSRAVRVRSSVSQEADLIELHQASVAQVVWQSKTCWMKNTIHLPVFPLPAFGSCEVLRRDSKRWYVLDIPAAPHP